MNEVILNWLMMVLTLELLKLPHWIRRESLLALRSLRLNSTNNVILSVKPVGLRWQNEVVVDVHQASDSLQKVRRGRPSHNQPSIVCSLPLRNFLPTAIKRVVHETGGPLRLLRLATMHRLVNAPCRVVLLGLRTIGLAIVGWALSSQGLLLGFTRLQVTSILAQRSLDVLRV